MRRTLYSALGPLSRIAPILLVLGILIGGCGLPENHEEVGSTHVSVVSVTRWDDYKDALQPEFALSEADALKQTLPDTLQLEQSVLDAVQATAQLKLAPSDILPPGFAEGESGNVPLVLPDGESLRVKEAQDVTDAAKLGIEPNLRYLAATALYQEVKLINRYIRDAALREGYRGYVVRLQLSSMPLQRNTPIDIYLNLSFFMEKVGLSSVTEEHPWIPLRESFSILNDQPTDAHSLKGQDSPERVVSELQDVFTKLTVSSEGSLDSVLEAFEKEKATWGRAHAIAALLSRINAVISKLRESQAARDLTRNYGALTKDLLKNEELDQESRTLVTSILGLQAAMARLEHLLEAKTPIVLPLLVTDQIEAAIASRRQERLRELVLAISAAYAGIGGGASIQSVQQALEASLGRDFNSLLTTARLTDNTLRVRIGARHSGSAESNYSAIPQNHYVSLLLLVPASFVGDQGSTAFVSSRTVFVDVESGKAIASSVSDRDDGALKAVAENHVLFDEERLQQALPLDGRYSVLKAESIGRLARLAQHNDYDAYLTAIIDSMNVSDPPTKADLLNGEYGALARSLWGSLVALRTGSRFDQTEIPLKRYPEVDPNIPDQDVLLVDSGKQTIARIGNTQGLDPELVRASWTFKIAEQSEVTFAARSVDLEGGHQLTLEFPSAKQAKMSPAPGKVRVWAEGQGWELDASWIEVSAASVPGLKVQRTQKSILEGDSKVTLQFSLTKEAKALAQQALSASDSNFETLVKDGKHVFLFQVEGAATVKSLNGLLRESKTAAPLHHAIVKEGVETLELEGVSDDKVIIRFISPEGFVAPDPLEFTVRSKKP
ncbi:MAG: hypothetical protein RL885_02465 [Planctomycetota bacterium]